MKHLTLFIGILFFITVGCDRKAEREKALRDLDAAQAALEQVNQQLVELEALLNRYNVELEVANDNIARVKEFQLLRTEAERDEQLRAATSSKLELEDGIRRIYAQTSALQDSALRTQHSIEKLKEFLKN